MTGPSKTSQNSRSEIFWNIATKWYFFPLIILLMVIVLTIHHYPTRHDSFLETKSIAEFGAVLLIRYIVIPMPIIDLLNNYVPIGGWPLMLASHIFIIGPIVLISYFKTRRNRTLKWLTLALLAFLIMSFVANLRRDVIGYLA